MEEERGRILRSYSKVWRLERLLYQIGKVNLPSPIAVYTIIYWMGFAVLMMFLGVFDVVKNIPVIYRFLIIPGALAYFFKYQKLDGKNPFAFFRSIILHYYVIFFKGSRVSRFRYIKPEKRKVRFNSILSYRILEREGL